MALEFADISCKTPGGVRALSIDFVNCLKSGEEISTIGVTCDDTSVITVSSVTSVTTVAHWTITVIDLDISSIRPITFDIAIVGDAGTKDVFQATIDVVHTIADLSGT